MTCHLRERRVAFRFLSVAILCILTQGSLSSAMSASSYPSAPAETSRPKIVSDLDCRALDVDTSALQRALITPGERDPKAIMAQAFPSGPPMEKIKAGQELDPASLCHYADANAQLPRNVKGRVVFIGDSITEGWAKAAPNLFSGEVIDRGISGQNSSQVLARFRADVVGLRPAAVHIMVGLNDINLPSGTVLTRDNIASMVDIAKANGITVVLASITPSDRFWPLPELRPAGEIRALNAWLKTFSVSQHIKFVDYYTALASVTGGFRPGLSNEGMHPNARGYGIMTPIAKQAISRVIGSSSSSIRHKSASTVK